MWSEREGKEDKGREDEGGRGAVAREGVEVTTRTLFYHQSKIVTARKFSHLLYVMRGDTYRTEKQVDIGGRGVRALGGGGGRRGGGEAGGRRGGGGGGGSSIHHPAP
ncbi:hypothetical protein E2C01_097579 [Portunus trituberculatus]|uniref:Uncharacterized protein n=1 Tax=Portunus trituberculatus TaxID=210409 RepID=A0A5B7K635_PORTR|nr:hypothetical protein [Portunus trituberculatus]